MQKIVSAVTDDLILFLALVLVLLQMGQAQEIKDAPKAFTEQWGNLSCQEKQTFVIKQKDLARAKAKVRLVNLLRESLADDEKGIIDLKKDKEIQALVREVVKHD